MLAGKLRSFLYRSLRKHGRWRYVISYQFGLEPGLMRINNLSLRFLLGTRVPVVVVPMSPP